MGYQLKQIQEFNGLEELELKQGKGRFNLFTNLNNLWENFFRSKVEENTGSYTKLVGKIDSALQTLEIFENTTGKNWTIENITTGNVELTADSTFDHTSAILLLGGCAVPGSYVYGCNDPNYVIIQFLDASGITYTDMVVHFELRLY